MSTDAAQWGRVAEDGRVYVRTPDGGEREVGSWQAGEPEAALDFYGRRYDDLVTELTLLEKRLGSGSANATETQAALRKLRESVDSAAVVGDLAGLATRIDLVLAHASAKRAEERDARAAAAEQVMESRRALAEEAATLAASSAWKAAGDRIKAIVDEWKALKHGTHATKEEETALWHRISVARREFDKRRKVHFESLESQREESKDRKEALIREAEKLSSSTEWGPTAKRFKELMTSWKAAGRAARGDDDALWTRFKAAQDAFFTRRTEDLAKRDASLGANLEAKEALLTEAEKLDPEKDLAGSQNRLRDLLEKWEKVGHVPREWMAKLDERMNTVERKVRDAVDAQLRKDRPPPRNPLVDRLRESIGKLERKAERGDAKAAAELETQRAWLAQAEQSLGRR